MLRLHFFLLNLRFVDLRYFSKKYHSHSKGTEVGMHGQSKNYQLFAQGDPL
jgi:hypothetical protein